MKKFNRKFEIGTKVLVEDIEGWQQIKSIHGTRLFCEIEGYEGSFQREHIIKFKNNKAKIKLDGTLFRNINVREALEKEFKRVTFVDLDDTGCNENDLGVWGYGLTHLRCDEDEKGALAACSDNEKASETLDKVISFLSENFRKELREAQRGYDISDLI